MGNMGGNMGTDEKFPSLGEGSFGTRYLLTQLVGAGMADRCGKKGPPALATEQRFEFFHPHSKPRIGDSCPSCQSAIGGG